MFQVIKSLCGGSWNKLPNETLTEMIDEIMLEGDLDEDGYLNFNEFEHVIDKSPNFADTFRFLL